LLKRVQLTTRNRAFGGTDPGEIRYPAQGCIAALERFSAGGAGAGVAQGRYFGQIDGLSTCSRLIVAVEGVLGVCPDPLRSQR
jgi:hypothetical protein